MSFHHSDRDFSRYVINVSVRRQLSKQVQEENALQRSKITMQQNAATFESTVIRDIQSTWNTFEDAQSSLSSSTQQTWKIVANAMHSFVPDREWNHFSKNDKHLLDPETPLRDPDAITYPQQEERSIACSQRAFGTKDEVHSHIQRIVLCAYRRRFSTRIRILRSTVIRWQRAGILALFPTCSLGPPSSTSAKSAKFTIEGKDGKPSTDTGSLRILKRNKEHAWIFRSQNRTTMMEWWNAIRPFCTIDPYPRIYGADGAFAQKERVPLSEHLVKCWRPGSTFQSEDRTVATTANGLI